MGNAYSAYPFPFLCETFGAQPVYVGANLISWFHQPQDSDKVATPKMPELMNCLCVEPPAVPQNDTMAVDPMNYQKWAIPAGPGGCAMAGHPSDMETGNHKLECRR